MDFRIFKDPSRTRSQPALDPMARRKLLFSLSQPTNPVPGALLAHIESQATPSTIHAWENNGWVNRERGNYYLTKFGSETLRSPSPPPPDSYYPIEFR